MAVSAAERIESVLSEQALFVSELVARLREFDRDDVLLALASLDGSRVLLVDHVSPDPHLSGDLRVAALVDPADPRRSLEAADQVWSRWLREVLSNHRCG